MPPSGDPQPIHVPVLPGDGSTGGVPNPVADPGTGDVSGQPLSGANGPFDATLGLSAQIAGSPAQPAGLPLAGIAYSNSYAPVGNTPHAGWPILRDLAGLVGFRVGVSALSDLHPILGALGYALGFGALVPSMEGSGYWNSLGAIGALGGLGSPGGAAPAPRAPGVPSMNMGLGGGPPSGRAVVGGLRGVPPHPPIAPGDFVINPQQPKALKHSVDILERIQDVPTKFPHLVGALPEVYFEHVTLTTRGLDAGALNAAKQLLQPGGQIRILTGAGPQFDQAVRGLVQSVGGVISSATPTVTSGGSAALEFVVVFLAKHQ